MDHGIRAELTCTTRTGLQRYTFPESGQARILFDLLFPTEYGKTVHAGAPWLTQKWTRAIMEQYYGHTPFDGWPGDEDQGQGGAWFVMSALGLFQTDGGCRVDPLYEIGSPLFERAVVQLDPKYYGGKAFVIEARNNSPSNVYIQSATLNGKPLNKPWFPVKEALNGGRLLLEMGPQPNLDWGARAENAPPQP